MRRMLWPLLAACLLIAPFLYRDSAQAVNVAGCPTSAAPCYVTGTGTAGSAATGVITVQGIASGTAQPVSGTVTSQFSSNNAAATPHACSKQKYVHTTSATDTQVVAASGSTVIYICGYAIAVGAVADTVYLEQATSGTCATLTQIDMAWALGINGQGGYILPYYEGLATASSSQLCVNTSSAGPADIVVYYDQY